MTGCLWLQLRDTPLNGYNVSRLAAMQAGKIAGSFADSGDNFGGAYLMPGGKRYVLLQERLISRFAPLRYAPTNNRPSIHPLRTAFYRSHTWNSVSYQPMSMSCCLTCCCSNMIINVA